MYNYISLFTIDACKRKPYSIITVTYVQFIQKQHGFPEYSVNQRQCRVSILHCALLISSWSRGEGGHWRNSWLICPGCVAYQNLTGGWGGGESDSINQQHYFSSPSGNAGKIWELRQQRAHLFLNQGGKKNIQVRGRF